MQLLEAGGGASGDLQHRATRRQLYQTLPGLHGAHQLQTAAGGGGTPSARQSTGPHAQQLPASAALGPADGQASDNGAGEWDGNVRDARLRDLWAISQGVRRLLGVGFDKRGLQAQYTDPAYAQRAPDLFLYPPTANLEYIELMGNVYGVPLGDVKEVQADAEVQLQRMVAFTIMRQLREAKAAVAAGAAVAGGAAAQGAAAGLLRGAHQRRGHGGGERQGGAGAA